GSWGFRKLDGPAARGAKMRTVGRQRATLRAEAAGADRDCVSWDHNIMFRGAGPNKRDDPADDGPAEKKVDYENTRGVCLVAPNESREEVNQNRENHEKHFQTPSARIRPKASTPELLYLAIRGANPVCSKHLALKFFPNLQAGTPKVFCAEHPQVTRKKFLGDRIDKKPQAFECCCPQN